eukprot:1158879-Pelagomonas_calceolata.AAC.1
MAGPWPPRHCPGPPPARCSSHYSRCSLAAAHPRRWAAAAAGAVAARRQLPQQLWRLLSHLQGVRVRTRAAGRLVQKQPGLRAPAFAGAAARAAAAWLWPAPAAAPAPAASAAAPAHRALGVDGDLKRSRR